jgi:hypothetical protein
MRFGVSGKRGGFLNLAAAGYLVRALKFIASEDIFWAIQ